MRKLLFKDLSDWEIQLHRDECNGGKMDVNYYLESSRKFKHKLSDISDAMEMKMKTVNLTVLINELRSGGVLTDCVLVVNVCMSCLSVPLLRKFIH